MQEQVAKRVRERMDHSLDHLKKELGAVRTGRASLSLFDEIKVPYYGTPTPLKGVATLSIPDPRSIMIQPWDPKTIPEIEKAILASGIGITPQNDGKIIRIPIPSLTEERRRELGKLVKKIGEETKVAVRNVRRDAIEELKKMQKEETLSEDAFRKDQEEIQRITDQNIHKVDEIIAKKESEILEV